MDLICNLVNYMFLLGLELFKGFFYLFIVLFLLGNFWDLVILGLWVNKFYEFTHSLYLVFFYLEMFYRHSVGP